MGPGAVRIEHCNDALQAEACGALEALQYVMSMGIAKAELEMDAVNLCEVLISAKFDLASIGLIVKDLKALMHQGFHSVRVLHTPRSFNRVADHLAHLGSELGPGQSGFGLNPALLL